MDEGEEGLQVFATSAGAGRAHWGVFQPGRVISTQGRADAAAEKVKNQKAKGKSQK